jgi:hypothetical protein
VPVKWLPKSDKEWFDISNKCALLVGVVGDFKTGKSFLVSKLAKKENY